MILIHYDFVLKYLGNIVTIKLKKVDYTFRLFGEEFAVVMPSINLVEGRFLGGLKNSLYI